MPLQAPQSALLLIPASCNAPAIPVTPIPAAPVHCHSSMGGSGKVTLKPPASGILPSLRNNPVSTQMCKKPLHVWAAGFRLLGKNIQSSPWIVDSCILYLRNSGERTNRIEPACSGGSRELVGTTQLFFPYEWRVKNSLTCPQEISKANPETKEYVILHISLTIQLCEHYIIVYINIYLILNPPVAVAKKEQQCLEVECVASPVSWSPKRQQFLTSERPSLSPQKLPADLPLNLWQKRTELLWIMEKMVTLVFFVRSKK